MILNKDAASYPMMKKFISREVKDYLRFYDPLRAKIRIMPAERVGIVIGKEPDFYFVKAAK